MRKFFLTIFFAAMVSAGFAQASYHKNYLVLKGAAVFATGTFASTNVNNKGNGFAETGTHSAIEYNHFLGKNWGFGLTASKRNNNFDALKFAEELVKDAPELRVTVFANPYKTNFFHFSGIFQVQASEKFSLYSKLSLGAATSTLPYLAIAYYKGPERSDYAREEKKKVALAGGLGTGLRYNLGKVDLGFEVSALNTSPTFKFTGKEITPDMNTINAGLTLSYGFM